ncbi:MAG: response regulator transcription factor, partial [Aeromonas sobria]
PRPVAIPDRCRAWHIHRNHLLPSEGEYMTPQTYRYPVTATHLKTGEVHHFPSIAATADQGFCPNMVRLCLVGQQDQYSGFTFTTTAPLRPTGRGSARIEEAARLSSQGLTNQQIADEMGISIHTVKFHKQRAGKMGLITMKRRGK